MKKSQMFWSFWSKSSKYDSINYVSHFIGEKKT